MLAKATNMPHSGHGVEWSGVGGTGNGNQHMNDKCLVGSVCQLKRARFFNEFEYESKYNKPNRDVRVEQKAIKGEKGPTTTIDLYMLLMTTQATLATHATSAVASIFRI